MQGVNTFENTNPIIKDSILGSKFFNPDYLFHNLVEFSKYIFTSKTLEILYIVLSILAIFFIFIIIYSTIRIFEIRKKEHAHLHHEIAEYAHKKSLEEKKLKEVKTYKDARWSKVLEYVFSNNENDWKLGIIEADSMLFDLLSQLKFKGETLGDKLKEANRDTFHSLSSAWEVHNIRNKIAHEGSNFYISSQEAKRVIALYESIFKEFDFI